MKEIKRFKQSNFDKDLDNGPAKTLENQWIMKVNRVFLINMLQGFRGVDFRSNVCGGYV